MKPCFSTLGCPEATIDEVIDLARSHGYTEIELRGLEGELDLPALWVRRGYTPESLVAKIRAAGLQVVALGTSFRLMGADAESRDQLFAFVPWAEALGGAWLRVFDGGSTLSDVELKSARAEIDTWRSARAHGSWRCDWMIETHDSLLHSEALNTFLRAVPADVRLLWDSHHTWRKGGEEPRDTWAVIRGRVVHLHVKDSVTQSGAANYRYVLPGQGEYPFAQLREVLNADRFSGALSLEWEKKWHPDLPELEAALTAARAAGWV